MVIDLIEDLRKAIDELDEEILSLISKRKDLVKEVGKLKENLDLPIFDKKREEEIIKNLSKKAKKLGLDISSVSTIFDAIFNSSRTEQQKNMDKIECKIRNIGLIGFGRFGKLVVRHLSDDFSFYVYNKSDKNKEIKENNAIPSTLKEACSKELVVLAVPISELKSALNGIKNLIKKGT